MTTHSDINQLNITDAEAAEALALLERAITILRLKPIANDDKARMARVEEGALSAYQAIAELAERRPDIIPDAVCSPALMRGDLSDIAHLKAIIATAQHLIGLARDSYTAAISDVVREGNAGYAIAARVADRDMDVNAAIEPLRDVFKRRGRR